MNFLFTYRLRAYLFFCLKKQIKEVKSTSKPTNKIRAASKIIR